MKQPIPINELFPPAPPVGKERNSEVADSLEVDADGCLLISKRTEPISYCYMLPCFIFYGCCMPAAKCVDILFDDNHQTVTVSEFYPLTGLCPTKKTYPYSNIANVGFERSINAYRNGQIISQTLRPLLVIADATTYEFSQPLKNVTEGEALVLKLHRFVFGRADPTQYFVPDISSLMIRQYHGC